MTYDEFLLKNKRIIDMLDRIAKRTESMALVNCANSSNEEFVAIMQHQEKLLINSKKLLDAFENQNNTEV